MRSWPRWNSGRGMAFPKNPGHDWCPQGGSRPSHAALADLYRRLGKKEEAREAYLRALELTHQEPQRRFIQRRLAEL